MGLKELRENRNMTQQALAAQSGVDLHALQNYEQGHEKLSSAVGDTLLRLSTVLGCSLIDLLKPDDFVGADLLENNQISVSEIQIQKLYCERYNVWGRWICKDGAISTFFYYEGVPYCLPFCALFTPKMLFCLREAAALQIETKIDEIMDEKNGFESW